MNYIDYCRPTLGYLLHCIGLDVKFHRADKQYLYYYDDTGVEREVLDLFGGYGALLLGHNNTDIMNVLQELISHQVPFHNQLSNRTGVGDLASLLNPILQDQTGWNERFLCNFTSTGAESVEVAIKHAEFSRHQKIEQLTEKLNQSIQTIDSQLEWSISDELVKQHPALKDDDITQRLREIQDWNNSQLNQAPIFIALKHAFHGKLNTSVQLTHGNFYREPFKRLGLKTHFIESDKLSIESIEYLYSNECTYALILKKQGNQITIEKINIPLISAIIVEPIQGEGGVYCLSFEQANSLHVLRDYLDCPLIADEIQSGCGRCGSFLAGSQIGLQPDYVVLSKGLGGGVSKIGVVAIREGHYMPGFDLIQTSTFGEDEWSAQIAQCFIQLLTEDNHRQLQQIRDLGEILGSALSRLQEEYPDIIAAVRGKGLLYGIELNKLEHNLSLLINTTQYQEGTGYLLAGALFARWGLRVAPPTSNRNVIRIVPSIQLTEENIQHLIGCLGQLCMALRYQDAGYLFAHIVGDPEHLASTPQDYRHWYQQLNHDPSTAEADIKVAFVNHLISSDWMKEVDPSIERYSDEQVNDLIERLSIDRRVAPFSSIKIRSLQGQTVEFTLYPINLTSQQISTMMESGQLEELRHAVDERLAAARDDGCHIAGLGMFTSIISNNGKAVETSGINLTTGNALTVAMAAEAVTEALKKRIEQSRITQQVTAIQQAAIIGAAGNIGSVFSSLVAEYSLSLLLVGSGREGSKKRLIKTAASVYKTVLTELYEEESTGGLAQAIQTYAKRNSWLRSDFLADKQCGEKVYQWFKDNVVEGERPIQLSQTAESVGSADLVVCAANAPKDFLQKNQLKQEALICDIAVPHNISEDLLTHRPDIQCIRGGIVSTPHGESLDPRGRAYLNAGQLYACMAETVVLGFEKYNGHYSYGNISKQQVKTIMSSARKHGLTLSDYKTSESM